MKVALVGFAVEGKSALPYWQQQGAEVTICDQDPNKDVPPGVNKQLGPDYLKNLDRFDVIVRTVGMHPQKILDVNPSVKDKITTNINEFFRVCPTKNIIGVTGTKGKGTTCSLIVKMLQAAGKDAHLGGNYGTPAFSFLPKLTKDSWVVMELSSFMLYDIKYSPHIGVCLMIESEHLDWHLDANDYYHAKSNMFAYQNEHDVAIYYANSQISHNIVRASPGDKIAYYDEPGAYIHEGNIMIDQTVLCKTNELKLLGKHNWQNACAAATAFWQVAQAPDAIRKVLTTFSGLEHRLEFVREVNGVSYYDDSFATIPGSSIVAIDAIDKPKVIILGGSDKGAAYDKLVAKIKQSDVRAVIIIGSTGPTIAAELRAADFKNIVNGGNNIQEIVSAAAQAAKPGDAVLLSPACASFDMFKDYKDRGNQFKAAVHAL